MIVRRCFISTIFVVLTLLGVLSEIDGERWSRQVSHSEWIPLANPRIISDQTSEDSARRGLLASSTHLSQIPSISLPPALQHQYQEQLVQLQKTQDSIQKLLLLQQQLRAQQQLLQSQAYVPNDFSSVENQKQALPLTSLGNLQTSAQLTQETLVPPHPSTEALPPVYPAQNFLSGQRTLQVHRPNYNQNPYVNQELSNLPIQGPVVFQHGSLGVENTPEGPHNYIIKQGSQKPSGKRLKGQPSPALSQFPFENTGNEEEEVQLVYVPAETLAQRGQLQKIRGRKQYPVRQQNQQLNENQGNIKQTSFSPDQETFAQQVLQQVQKNHDEKAQFLKAEREQEFVKLSEEQLLRLREMEKKQKELQKLEEVTRQRELERIRESREKQRQEELERRRITENRAKEERRRDEEIKQREERQKQLNLQQTLKQQKILENQRKEQLRSNGAAIHQNGQAQALIREQPSRQQFTENTRPKKIRGRQRQPVNQEQSIYQEVSGTTTPSPNQPPLSVYMEGPTSKLEPVKVTDVLKLLKDAKTIAVLDNVSSDAPQVFVGPTNLEPPYGYAKFDLPYLSSLDHNRVERKVDKLPFFVAPLSFEPPPGYSKIPFPAPHIGSVVINTLSETSSESEESSSQEQNSNLRPLIEPNAYIDAVDQSESTEVTSSSRESSTIRNFSPQTNSPKYESTYSTPNSGSKLKFKHFYDNKPTSALDTSYYTEQSTKTKPKQYYEQEAKLTTQSPKVETMISYRQEVSFSTTPSYQDRTVVQHVPSTKKQDIAQQRESQKYNNGVQYHSHNSNLRETYDVNDVRGPIGLTRYHLPAELPAISPHLPGLVNSLVDKQQDNFPLDTTLPSTTTTTMTTPITTTRASTTTHKSRGRGRITTIKPRTTEAPTTTDKIRRPQHNRSKSRFSTTTEDYHDSTYEPTRARIPETTQKYNTMEHRRPTSRTQKHRNRDRSNSQSAIPEQKQNSQAINYENYPTQIDSLENTSPDVYSQTSGTISNLHQKETPPSPTVTDFTRETYSPTASPEMENYPLLRQVTIQHGIPLMSDDYSRSQNYPQTRQQQEVRYHQAYNPNNNFEPQPDLEKNPVNGFNYQVDNEESLGQTIPPRSKEYPHYQTKLEDTNYNLPTTEISRVSTVEEHRYSSLYEDNAAQTQPDYTIGGQNLFNTEKYGKIESSTIDTEPNTPPIFIPLPHSKQEDYELQTPAAETPLNDITSTTTTPAPVIIRQRLRTRLGSRTHPESSAQTRSRGPQEEYVRFSAVNQDRRQGSKTSRIRTRPQNQGSQVQTDGNDYIRIHSAQQQRLTATTIPSTSVSSTTARTIDEDDVDYGFIRPPNFRQVQDSVQTAHPLDNRFQTPVTYRPSYSEHIISNDETAVGSSPTQVLNDRSRYHQSTNRHSITKAFATTTTTEAIPVATAFPNKTVYTVKPRTRPEESPSTTRGTRGRIRRPGKKRTTTTTESALEANNELPLDENYPRLTAQRLQHPVTRQQSYYDDNFGVSQRYHSNQNQPSHFYEENGENYSSQEYKLNYGNLPEQIPQREEYEQTYLDSSSSRRYGPTPHSSSDIYGAESQWSTKLSFQPNIASNHVVDQSKKDRTNKIRNDHTDEDTPEIITTAPEVPSAAVIVSSDYQKNTDQTANMDETTFFGRKTNAQEKLNTTTAVTDSPTTMLHDKTGNDKETRGWMWDRAESPVQSATEQIDPLDATKMTKKIIDPLASRKSVGTRRRRVRVRVRPVTNDFVTAESQHYKSATNSLIPDEYNIARESKSSTVRPNVTSSIATTTISSGLTKSLLQDLLEEMLKNHDTPVPARVTSITTTEMPDWAFSTSMTTSYNQDEEDTTLRENYTTVSDTVISNTDKKHPITATESSAETKNESQKLVSPLRRHNVDYSSQDEIPRQRETKSEEYQKKESREDTVVRNNLRNVNVFSRRYKLPLNRPDETSVLEKVKNTDSVTTEFPTVREEDIRKLSAVEREKEHVMTLPGQKEAIEEEHPKNHRTKWSEVRYPLNFDKSQTTVRSHATTPVPGVVTQNEGDNNTKTLSDYVRAIFDSMKSAEEEEEVAKVVEAKNESTDKPTNNKLNETSVKTSTERNKIDETVTDTKMMEATTMITDTSTMNTPEIESPVNTVVPKTGPIRRTVGDNVKTNSTDTMLNKIVRTSTSTKVSHMTEICYRGRCVMTRPKMENATR